MFYYSKDLKKKQNVLIDSIKLIDYNVKETNYEKSIEK